MNVKRLLMTFVLPMALLFSLPAMAQNKLVTGRVNDAKDGSPLSGVTVLAKGTSIGTQTGADGQFKLSVPAGATTLTISSVGYASQDVAIGAGPILVSLTQVSGALTDVVVVGYGTLKKKELTGSITVVTAKDFQTGTITTPEQMLAGKAAGVSITSGGGSPGSNTTIRIRGGASLNAANDPLIVVDGVPLAALSDGINGVANTLSLINPDDIESFTILKDASAAAIYGSRGSNGVIIITTKHGRAGKGVFNFSTNFSVSHIIKEIPVMDGPTFTKFVDTLAENHANVVDAADTALLGTANTDWQKQIYQTAVNSNNNLSYSGSIARKTPYRLGMNYLDQDGILKTDQLQRVTGTFSITPRFFDDHLKLEINFHASYTDSRFANTAAIGNALLYDPTAPVYATKSFNGNPYYGWYVDRPTGSSTGGDTTNFNNNAPVNPVEALMRTTNTGKVSREFGNIQADYKLHFFPDLHIVANWGFDFSKGLTNNYTMANTFNNLLGNNNPGEQHIDNETFQGYLNYIKDIKSIRSNINVTAGYEQQNFLSWYLGEYNFYANGDTIPNTKPLYPTYPAQHTIESFFGRLVYTLDNKYVLAASVRDDGSSRFGPAYRWGTFPSVSLTWRINQENFLKNSDVVSDLKLRGSYGVTGNQDGLGNYGYQPQYVSGNIGTQYLFGGTGYYTYNPQFYISNLVWEQTQTANLGLDYGFLNNRINGSIDLYDRKTKNLYVFTNIPAGANYQNTGNVNLGNMESKGIEASINWVLVRNRQVTWEVGVNGSYDQHTITNLTFPGLSNTSGSPTGALPVFMSPTVQINTVGQTPYSYYLYKQVYNTNGQPVEGLYGDMNRDGEISNSDLVVYKSPTPPVILGFSTQATIGKWTISTVLRANIGNYNYNVVDANLAIAGNALNAQNLLQNVPTAYFKTQFLNNEFLSNYYVENASFLKMDNLGVAYHVGRVIDKKVDLRISANCQNVFTVTKYTGIDPEVYGGLDNNLYPRPRIYTLSLNLVY